MADSDVLGPSGIFDRVGSAFSSGVQSVKNIFNFVAPGAERPQVNVAQVNITSPQISARQPDMRVRIKVPSSYLTGYTTVDTKLSHFGGIVFPYTPQITYENKADYSPIPTVHSNYQQSFYSRSSISGLNISGKFTVQNTEEAQIYLATVHLLKALTKMRVGKDLNAGSPPPVCRLFAYGQFMLENVPIAITSFRIDLPEGVDYFTNKLTNGYGLNAVPTLSTITLGTMVMYSRNEIKNHSVDKWLNNTENHRKQGYL